MKYTFVSKLAASFLLAGMVGLLPTPVLAASPSPSPRASVTPSPSTAADPSVSPSPNLTQTTQRLKERIEKIVEEKRDQIEGALDELASQRRGFIGEIQRVSAETITLKTVKGTQILPLTSAITITKAGKAISLDTIAVGDWAIVVGALNNDEFQVNQLQISSTSLRPRPQVIVLGTVKTVARSSIAVQPRSGDPAATQFNLVRDTEYQDLEGNPIRVADIKVDTQVLAVGLSDEEGVDALVIRSLTPASTEADN